MFCLVKQATLYRILKKICSQKIYLFKRSNRIFVQLKSTKIVLFKKMAFDISSFQVFNDPNDQRKKLLIDFVKEVIITTYP